jgi:hypothetical protein
MQKAIAESKKTAKKEERGRKSVKGESNSGANDKDDFDVGLGFEKFATSNESKNGNDIDDFDFTKVNNKNEE